MFPLGSVLFPGTMLPLQVFEPRYRTLLSDVMAGDGSFGTCLIERGSEVGGGDQRTAVGTMARIVDVTPMPNGRLRVVVGGTTRIRVDEWLPDDPYPLAVVHDHPDPPAGPAELTSLPDLRRVWDEVAVRVSELEGVPALAFPDLPDDPVLASHVLAACCPVNPLDQHRLLVAPTVGMRLGLLGVLLSDVRELLDLRLRLREDDGA